MFKGDKMKYDAKKARLEKAMEYLRISLNNLLLAEDYAAGFKGEINEIKKPMDDLIYKIDYYINNYDLLKETAEEMEHEAYKHRHRHKVKV